jgi:osmotically-inducible protein OsmY
LARDRSIDGIDRRQGARFATVIGLAIEAEGDAMRRAEEAVRRVRGMKGITNSIEVKPRAVPMEIRRKIEEALRRAAELDANRITVEVNGDEVILRGTVRSWAERQEAQRAAWLAPGVAKVDNRISVSP